MTIMEQCRLTELTSDQMDQLICELQQTLYRNNRTFRPVYPWVFVRVLPKEQKTAGGVILPENHNKTLHEGIVVSVWRPFHKALKNGGRVFKASQFMPGQHLLFPHWCGMPVSGFDTQKWRLVKEEEWHETKEGGIIGEVMYDGDLPRSVLDKIVYDAVKRTDAGLVHPICAAIMERYFLIDKQAGSVTLSGK